MERGPHFLVLARELVDTLLAALADPASLLARLYERVALLQQPDEAFFQTAFPTACVDIVSSRKLLAALSASYPWSRESWFVFE